MWFSKNAAAGLDGTRNALQFSAFTQYDRRHWDGRHHLSATTKFLPSPRFNRSHGRPQLARVLDLFQLEHQLAPR